MTSNAAYGSGLSVRPWRDGLDDEIDAEQEYELGARCPVCGEPSLNGEPGNDCGRDLCADKIRSAT